VSENAHSQTLERRSSERAEELLYPVHLHTISMHKTCTAENRNALTLQKRQGIVPQA